MVESKGGVWRRDKKGNLEQIKAPATPQKYGAHDRHPATVKSGADAGSSKSQQQSVKTSSKQENSSDADT